MNEFLAVYIHKVTRTKTFLCLQEMFDKLQSTQIEDCCMKVIFKLLYLMFLLLCVVFFFLRLH